MTTQFAENLEFYLYDINFDNLLTSSIIIIGNLEIWQMFMALNALSSCCVLLLVGQNNLKTSSCCSGFYFYFSPQTFYRVIIIISALNASQSAVKRKKRKIWFIQNENTWLQPYGRTQYRSIRARDCIRFLNIGHSAAGRLAFLFPTAQLRQSRGAAIPSHLTDTFQEENCFSF